MVRLASIEEKDYPRLLSLMEKYKERPMDLADATLVVTADRFFLGQHHLIRSLSLPLLINFFFLYILFSVFLQN